MIAEVGCVLRIDCDIYRINTIFPSQEIVDHGGLEGLQSRNTLRPPPIDRNAGKFIAFEMNEFAQPFQVCRQMMHQWIPENSVPEYGVRLAGNRIGMVWNEAHSDGSCW